MSAGDIVGRTAADLAGLIASGEVSARRGRAGSSRPHRRDRRRAACLPARVGRACAGGGRRDRRRSRSRRAARPARRGSARAEGRLRHSRACRRRAARRSSKAGVPPYDATVVQRLQKAGVVVLGKTNMDEFAMGSSTENSAYGADPQPLGHQPDPGRIVGRQRGRGRRRAGSAGRRHRHRRLDPPARCRLRDRRGEADVRARQPLRAGGVLLEPGPGRPVRPHRARRGAAARGDRGPRSDGLDQHRRLQRAGCRSRRSTRRQRRAHRVVRELGGAGYEPEVEARFREAVAVLEELGRESSVRSPARRSRSRCPRTTSSPPASARRTWRASTAMRYGLRIGKDVRRRRGRHEHHA